jgi:hypothetical protein
LEDVIHQQPFRFEETELTPAELEHIARVQQMAEGSMEINRELSRESSATSGADSSRSTDEEEPKDQGKPTTSYLYPKPLR